MEEGRAGKALGRRIILATGREYRQGPLWIQEREITCPQVEDGLFSLLRGPFPLC